MDSLDPLHKLGDKLAYIVDRSDLGYYDGHEIAMDNTDGSIYLYGINAEQLYKLIEPTLFAVGWMADAEVQLRFGPSSENAKRIEFVLEENIH